MKLALLFLLTLPTFASTPPLKEATLCNSTKEYVSTLKFLRDFEGLEIKENDARKIADQVSQGCNGAFNRFATITKMLSKVGIDSGTAAKHASQFAAETDEKAQVFIEVFKQTYSSNTLDLDALNALSISLNIAKETNSSSEIVLNDFKELVSFCKEEKKLGLPIPFCAQMAAKVTVEGSQFGKSIASEYIKLINFISDNTKGPTTDKQTAMTLAESVISNGPTSAENFIAAYRFAAAESGLKLTAKDAIAFAETMAKRSYQLKDKN